MIARPNPVVRASSSQDLLCYLLALIGGVAVWILPARMAGVVEAWDGPLWWLWLFGTPVLSFALGFIEPQKWWRWPFMIVGVQFAAIVVQSQQLGSLAPLGAVLFLAVAGLNLPPAFAGAALRAARRRAGADHGASGSS